MIEDEMQADESPNVGTPDGETSTEVSIPTQFPPVKNVEPIIEATTAPDMNADLPPPVDEDPANPAIKLDPTNTLPLSEIFQPRPDGVSSQSLLQNLESHIMHVVYWIEQELGAVHPELNSLKSVANNEIQALKLKV